MVLAADMSACGFNMDLAPVADVWSNPKNTVIGDRAWSVMACIFRLSVTTTPSKPSSCRRSSVTILGAQLVAAAVGGFHQGGVACTLKHFPGHGDTSADSHYGCPRRSHRCRSGPSWPASGGCRS